MSDRELADKLVALGVIRAESHYGRLVYFKPGEHYGQPGIDGDAESLVRDWRVAGAVMEQLVGNDTLVWLQAYPDLADHKVQPVWIVESGNHSGRDESLPRAIIEAGCEALSDE